MVALNFESNDGERGSGVISIFESNDGERGNGVICQKRTENGINLVKLETLYARNVCCELRMESTWPS